MKLNDLFNIPGSKKTGKRVGRGTGSGLGKTSGKGHKGQKARSGVAVSSNANTFEGGQMPIIRRLPKRGFNPINRIEYNIINLGSLSNFLKDSTNEKTVINRDFLVAHGLIKKNNLPIKLLAKGIINLPLELHVDKASESAVKAINSAGGSITLNSITK